MCIFTPANSIEPKHLNMKPTLLKTLFSTLLKPSLLSTMAIASVTTIFVCSCSTPPSETQEGDRWRIDGTVTSSNSVDTLYLYEPDTHETIVTLLVKNGKIVAKEGTEGHNAFCNVRFAGTSRVAKGGGVFLTYNSIHLDIQRNPDSIISVRGGEMNRDYQQICDSLRQIDPTKSLEDFRRYGDLLHDATKRIVRKYPSQRISSVMIDRCFYYLGADQILALIDSLDETMKSSNTISLNEEQARLRLGSEEGDMFKDLEGVNAKGKKAKLSDFVGKGKTVIVDFWNTHCIACKRNMKVMQLLHDSYKDKGLVVVGVAGKAHDNVFQQEKWLKDMKITYPQILDCPIMSVYGATTYPSFIVFGPDGRIVVPRNASLESLRPYFEEHFGPLASPSRATSK